MKKQKLITTLSCVLLSMALTGFNYADTQEMESLQQIEMKSILDLSLSSAVVDMESFQQEMNERFAAAIIEMAKEEEREKTKEVKYVSSYKGLNVRTEPNTDSKVKEVLAFNEKVEVYECKENEKWREIDIEEETYYVSNAFLSKEKTKPPVIVQKPAATSPTNTSKPAQNNTKPAPAQSTAGRSAGHFSITHYCNCSKCCGQWAGGPTKSGVMPTAGRTVASNFFPMGTRLVINGHTYVVEDTGGMANNVIDIYCGSHSEALNRGRYTVEVFYAS